MRLTSEQWTFYLGGLMILTLGISSTIVAGIGVGPFDALLVGLSNTIGLTVGSWEFLLGVILIFVNALMIRRKPDVLSLVTAFLTGALIDFWLFTLWQIWQPTVLVSQIVIFTIGLILAALGIAVYVQANFALNPNEGFMMAIKELLHSSLTVAKTINSLILLALAFAFSGPIGVGTIVSVLVAGPLIGLFDQQIHRLKDTKMRKAA